MLRRNVVIEESGQDTHYIRISFDRMTTLWTSAGRSHCVICQFLWFINVEFTILPRENWLNVELLRVLAGFHLEYIKLSAQSVSILIKPNFRDLLEVNLVRSHCSHSINMSDTQHIAYYITVEAVAS